MILFCSDVHGRKSSTDKLIKVIKKLKPTKIVMLGDFLYNGPRNGVPKDYDPMYVSQALNNYADMIIGIKGNCDSRIDETLLEFKLNDSNVVKIDGYIFNLVHGDRFNENLINMQRYEVLCYGHTHVYRLEVKNHVCYFNPGSISFPKNGLPATYGVCDNGILKIIDLENDLVLSELNLKDSL